MSSCVYQIFRKHNHFKNILTPKLQRNWKYFSFSAINNGHKKLGQTSVIVQDGGDVHELPTIVCKSSYNFTTELETEQEPVYKLVEVTEIILGFQRCEKVERLLLLIDIIPEDEIAPVIAVHAVKRLLELEEREQSESPDPQVRKFLLNKMIDKICVKHHTKDILEMLELLKNDPKISKDDSHLLRLCDHIMILNNDAHFTIPQIAEIIQQFKSLSMYPNLVEYIDKLWPGILSHENTLDVNTFKLVYTMLPMFTQSRKVVQNMLDKVLNQLWWILNQDEVCEILNSIEKNQDYNPKTLTIVTRWINQNINQVSDESLCKMVSVFVALEHCEPGLDAVLERFIKGRALHSPSIEIVATILEYCTKFRLRILTILDYASEGFIDHAFSMTPSEATKVVTAFGHLSYQPSKGNDFWIVFEEYLERNLGQFTPAELLDVMLSCIYMNKQPINFIDHIFSPSYLDILTKTSNETNLHLIGSKLKFLDTAMFLECSAYRGPYLSRNYDSKSLYVDNRIRRWITQIQPLIEKIVHPENQQVVTFLTLPILPAIENYIIDLFIYPYGQLAMINKMNLDGLVHLNRCIAVLLHPSDHYTDDGQLIGSQEARRRHFHFVGIKVIDLSLNKLGRIRVESPEALKTYLTSILDLTSLKLI